MLNQAGAHNTNYLLSGLPSGHEPVIDATRRTLNLFCDFASLLRHIQLYHSETVYSSQDAYLQMLSTILGKTTQLESLALGFGVEGANILPTLFPPSSLYHSLQTLSLSIINVDE
jgi:hypothetical protein